MEDIGSGIGGLIELVIRFLIMCIDYATMPFRYLLSKRYRMRKNIYWSTRPKRRVFDSFVSLLAILFLSYLTISIFQWKYGQETTAAASDRFDHLADADIRLELGMNEVTDGSESTIRISTENFSTEISLTEAKQVGRSLLDRFKKDKNQEENVPE